MHKKTLIMFSSQIYASLIGILMMPVYLNFLGVEAYGLIGFFTLLTSIASLLDAGMSQAVSRMIAGSSAMPKKDINGNVALSIGEQFLFITGVLLIVIVYFSSNFIANSWLKIDRLDEETVIKSVQLMGILMACRLLNGLYYGAMVGLEKQIFLGGVNVLMTSVKSFGSFILVKYFFADILSFFLFQTLIHSIELCIFHFTVRRQLPWVSRHQYEKNSANHFYSTSWQIVAVTISWVIFSNFDKILLSKRLMLHEFGYFSIVIALTSVFGHFSSSINQVISPRLVKYIGREGSFDKALRLYSQATRFVAAVLGSAFAVIYLFPEEIIWVLTGNLDAANWAAPVLALYAFSHFLLGLLTFQYIWQYAQGNLKLQLYYSLISPLIGFPIFYVSVDKFGALGAGWAWVFIQGSSLFVWTYIVHRKFIPGFHAAWLRFDVLPVFVSTFFVILFFWLIDFDVYQFGRLYCFLVLLLLGILTLALNLCLFYVHKNKFL